MSFLSLPEESPPPIAHKNSFLVCSFSQKIPLRTYLVIGRMLDKGAERCWEFFFLQDVFTHEQFAHERGRDSPAKNS